MSILDGLARTLVSTWWFLTTDGGGRDVVVMVGLFTVAALGFRFLYWVDLRHPVDPADRYVGRHRTPRSANERDAIPNE